MGTIFQQLKRYSPGRGKAEARQFNSRAVNLRARSQLGLRVQRTIVQSLGSHSQEIIEVSGTHFPSMYSSSLVAHGSTDTSITVDEDGECHIETDARDSRSGINRVGCV